MNAQKEQNPECCPPFNPAPWDNKIIDWENKRFIRDNVCTLFYMPLNFGGAMRRLNKKVETAGASVPEWLCLSDHTSKWNMNVYLAVDKEIPDAENILLTGKFFCKVYEGPFKDTGKWSKDFESIVASKGIKTSKWYMWYTTCPKCAKKYGKNYVVILGQVE